MPRKHAPNILLAGDSHRFSELMETLHIRQIDIYAEEPDTGNGFPAHIDAYFDSNNDPGISKISMEGRNSEVLLTRFFTTAYLLDEYQATCNPKPLLCTVQIEEFDKDLHLQKLTRICLEEMLYPVQITENGDLFVPAAYEEYFREHLNLPDFQQYRVDFGVIDSPETFELVARFQGWDNAQAVYDHFGVSYQDVDRVLFEHLQDLDMRDVFVLGTNNALYDIKTGAAKVQLTEEERKRWINDIVHPDRLNPQDPVFLPRVRHDNLNLLTAKFYVENGMLINRIEA